MTKPRMLTGAVVGGLLMLPLIALSFLGNAILGLTFLPFDVFNFIRDSLPGSLLTFGIDMMVDTIRALQIGPTDDTAKIAETIMALLMLVALGVVIGALYFLLTYLQKREWGFFPGAILGALLGAGAVLLLGRPGGSATTYATVLNALWVFVLPLAWGATLGWIYADLNRISDGETYVNTEGQRVNVSTINRRQFLVRLGGATAGITVVGAGLGAVLQNSLSSAQTDVETTFTAVRPEGTPDPNATAEALTARWSENNPLPNANDPLVPAPGTRPEFTRVEDHYRIDIALTPPQIDGSTWSVTIQGLVDNPVTLTLDSLRNDYEPVHEFITMSCISNRIGGDLISTQRWTGVRFQTILDEAGVQPEARYVKITSADGFHEMVDLELLRTEPSIMLCYAWDNQPLPVRNGFPLRIHIPDRYGMKQPKWITGIELVSEYEPGYWVRRSWDEVARVRAASVVDTVATADVYEQDGATLVPVGGIAWAGARGITRVEVRVDEGDWQEAQLRSPISEKTWVLWRYDWAFTPGDHTFSVRCVDGNGEPQIELEEGVRPSGATGIHSRRATL